MNFSPTDIKGVQVFSYSDYTTMMTNNHSGSFQALSVPTNGLVGEWKLDGNANDTSGNGNNGTSYNITWIDSGMGDGKKVASFNGFSSHIDIPYSNILEPSAEITISAWIKTNADYANTYAPIFRKGATYFK